MRNFQRTHPCDTSALREAGVHCLETLLKLKTFSAEVALVGPKRMAAINSSFLGHEGSTDVITFDYGQGYETMEEISPLELRGEIYICPEDAVAQSARFGTSWREEILRYMAHGFLHLLGHDDLEPKARARMKRKENQLTRALAAAGFVERV